MLQIINYYYYSATTTTTTTTTTTSLLLHLFSGLFCLFSRTTCRPTNSIKSLTSVKININFVYISVIYNAFQRCCFLGRFTIVIDLLCVYQVYYSDVFLAAHDHVIETNLVC